MVGIHRLLDDLGVLLTTVAAAPLILVGVSQRDAGLGRQELHRASEVQSLDFADEVDDVPRHLTPEAVVDALFGIDRERGRLLAVEWTQSHPLGAGLLELGVFGDDSDDVGLVADLPDVLVDDAHGRTVPPTGLPGRPDQLIALSAVPSAEQISRRWR